MLVGLSKPYDKFGTLKRELLHKIITKAHPDATVIRFRGPKGDDFDVYYMRCISSCVWLAEMNSCSLPPWCGKMCVFKNQLACRVSLGGGS